MLRPARPEDGDMLLRWRNHPDVRNASLTTHEISADEHEQWWSAVQRDATRLILIYERDGKPSGVVTFAGVKPERDSATWGFYLDVDGLTQRREMVPAWLEIEKEAVAYGFDELGLETLEGEVLADNDAVRQLHRRFDFAEVGSYRLDDGREVITLRRDRKAGR